MNAHVFGMILVALGWATALTADSIPRLASAAVLALGGLYLLSAAMHHAVKERRALVARNLNLDAEVDKLEEDIARVRARRDKLQGVASDLTLQVSRLEERLKIRISTAELNHLLDEVSPRPLRVARQNEGEGDLFD